MELRTKVVVEESQNKIGLNSKIVTIGSCFSEVLGSYLLANKIDCLANPFGTIFNLASLSNLIVNEEESVKRNDNFFFKNEDTFFNYNYHSSFAATNLEDLNNTIKTAHKRLDEFIQNADYLIITLGTSLVYELKSHNRIVSNCHKQNADLFEKKLLSIEEQKGIFRQLYNYLKNKNKNLKIILTVSPVRHLKDTLTLNNVSKSVLRLLCHELTQMYKNVVYFPAYEIMIDDLRDYRFYKNDLIHPSELAENYIITNFSEAYFELLLKEFIKEWQKIKLAIAHRPFNEKSKSHQEFLRKTTEKLNAFKNIVSVENELKLLEKQIIN
jgi:hypothetical protein